MITVAQLKQFLNDYPDTNEVRWSDGSQITHMKAVDGLVVLADRKPIGNCCRCGNAVYPELVNRNEYDGYCIICDENLYNPEIELFTEM